MSKNTLSAALALLASVGPGALASRAQSAGELLEKAIYAEETAGDVDRAIEIYKRVLAETASSRETGARAQHRLALCYLKLGRSAEAKAALEALVKAYPEQDELVASARKSLAQLRPALDLLPAPWRDGEVLELDALLPGGFDIGAFVLTAESADVDGRVAWRLGLRRAFASSESNQGVSTVLAERDSLAPIRSEFHHGMLGDVDATYLPGSVSIAVHGEKGTSERTIPVSGAVYDNEEALHLVRRLPLAVGYETDLGIVVPFGQGLVPMTFRVSAVESITVPAGTFECFKACFSIGQSVWISNDPERLVVRLDADGVSFQLRSAGTARVASSVAYRDAAFGFELTQPPGWYFAAIDSKPGKYLALGLLDPRAEVRCVLELGLVDEEEVGSVEERAREELARAEKRFDGFALRPETWIAGSVGGLPSIRFACDYRDGEQAMVQDRAYVAGRGRVAEFIFRVPADRYDALEPTLTEIVASYRVP